MNLTQLASNWYATLSTLNAAVTEPLRQLDATIGLPLVSALLFGLLGATSPCQLTTNAGALAYAVRAGGARRSIAVNATAYLFGKVLVYTLVGVAVILAGRQLAQGTIPIVVVARRALGPLMILLGLYFLGLVPLRFPLGQGLTDWLEARARPGAGGSFLLGIAFSFAFCPTLFLLFFGLTIPLALRSPVGVAYPAVFALGTTLPLLGFAVLLAAGAGARQGYLQGARRIDTWLRPAAGLVLILAGLNDTVIYWFI